MVALLEEAVERVRCLPADEQERFAALIIEELEQKARDDAFDALIASRPDVLAEMATAALAEFDAGLTEPLDLEKLL